MNMNNNKKINMLFTENLYISFLCVLHNKKARTLSQLTSKTGQTSLVVLLSNMSTLKENDLAVLNYIFDPNITGNYDIFVISEDCDNISGIVTEKVDVAHPKDVAANELEMAGVKAAEQGKVKEAIEFFSEALQVVERASGYNNRAQAFRLIGLDDDALDDLDKAVRLSKGIGKTARQALCQRASIFRKRGENEKAKEDFSTAAHLGSKFAQKQLIELNPYAAMCNQMLHQVMFQRQDDSK